MAKRGSIKSIQKSSPFKKLSATFISLVFLFVISIVLHFVFNKHSVENFQVSGNSNTSNSSYNKIEVALISSPAKMHTGHSFVRTNADWDRIKQTFGTNPAIIIATQDKSNIRNYITNPNFSNGDYPMVVITHIGRTSSGTSIRNYITHITRAKLSYNSVYNSVTSAINNNIY